MKSIFNIKIFSLSLLFSVAAVNAVLANPVLKNVASGNVSISQSANTTTVKQTSTQAIINWQSFNIDPNQTTQFIQPSASSSALNRISPSQGASQIYGSLISNGQIILVNAAGIHFGPNSTVNVGSIIVSTTDITNKNFNNGKFIFDRNATHSGVISNEGTITAANYGFVALLGNNVINSGLIQAELGNIVLASGSKFTLDFSGDQLINFSVDASTTTSGSITNKGALLADGGKILVSASAAQGVVDHIIDMEGVAQANSVDQINGEIILSDGAIGTVYLNGKLDAAGLGLGQTGGVIEVLGASINIGSNASLNVSGYAGGGQINVGGSAHGQGPLPNALTTTIASGASFNADATYAGNGGGIVIYSTGVTQVDANLSARGGSQSGNGGSVETSGACLDISSARVNLLAAHGETGNWLLDPTDVSIDNTGTNNDTYSSGTYTPGSANTSDILASDLLANLATSNVTVQTSSSGTTNGDIAVNAALSWSAATTLTLNATRNIYLNADITATNGGLTLSAVNNPSLSSGSIGSGTIGGTVGNVTANINVKNFTLEQGQWLQNSPSLPTFSATDFRVSNSGNAQFLRVLGGDGSSNPFLITDVYGLQGINSSVLMLASNFALANNIDASCTINWNAGAGFEPIADAGVFTGNFDGQYHTIDKLFENNTTYGSLFANVSYADPTCSECSFISNLGLTNVNITSNSSNFQGVLIGQVQGNTESFGGPTISNDYITGTATYIAGSSVIGGLVGLSNGAYILNDYSAVNLHVTGDGNFIGGLVGFAGDGGFPNLGQGDGPDADTLLNSYSIGNITVNGSSNDIGGLVGYNQSNQIISNTYASGGMTVIGSSNNIGGLVGENNSGSNLSNSFYDNTINTVATDVVGLDDGSNISAVSALSTSDTMTAATVENYLTSVTTSSSNSPNNNIWFMTDGGSRPILITEEFNNNQPLTITNAHQLSLVNADLRGSYTLGNNIDLSSVSNNLSEIFATNSVDGAGFVPIGNINTPFAGVLTGNYFVINNLYINNPTLLNTDIGLFGDTSTAAIIHNTGITNLVINNNAISGSIGGFVGNNAGGTLTGVYTTGSITNTASNVHIGGLIGTNSTYAPVFDSYSSVNINSNFTSGGSVFIGGLVGSNLNHGDIEQSYSSGNVVSNWTGSTNANFVGGFAGENQSSITDSYSLGNVSTNNTSALTSIGGFVGSNNDNGDGFTPLTVNINNAYSTGTVIASGSANIGGFAGNNVLNTSSSSNVSITNSFWDISTSNQNNGIGTNIGLNGSGTATLTYGNFSGSSGAKLSSAATYTTFASWNISNSVSLSSSPPGSTWFIFEGQTRPLLMMEYSTTITNAHQLQLAGSTLDASYNLANNIDLTNSLTNAAEVWGTNYNTSTGQGFVPIGPNSSTAFTGSFNGQNFTINRLYIKQSNTNLGLFGDINTSQSVNNIIFTNASVSGTTSAGVLTGELDSGSVSHIESFNSLVTGNTHTTNDGIGGLIGTMNDGTLSDAISSGSVFASNGDAGGIVGNIQNGIVSFAMAEGSVESDNNNTGGIAGSSLGTITDSFNAATLTGANNIGGIAGSLGSGGGADLINNSISIGNITALGGANPGGIVGANLGTVNNSFWDTQTSGISNGIGTGTALNGGVGGSFGSSSGANLANATTYLTGSSYISTSGGATAWSIAVAPAINSTWGIISNQSYPYLTALYATTPRTISGTVTGNSASDVVELSVNSTPLTDGENNDLITQATAAIGANGFYYYLESNGVITDGATITGTTSSTALTSSIAAPSNNGSVTLNIPSGLTFSGTVPNTTNTNSFVDLVYNGNIIASGNTTGLDTFSFVVPSSILQHNSTNYLLFYLSGANLVGNLVVSDGSNVAGLTGLNIFQNTIYINSSNTVSNTILHTTLGSLNTSDILFSTTSNGSGYDTTIGNGANPTINFTTSAATHYQLDGAISNTSGSSNITFNGAVTLAHDATIAAGTAGTITIANTVNDTTAGTDSLTLNASGGVIIENNIGTGTSINNFTIDTNTNETDVISANITTTNLQQYGNAITISNNPTLTSTNGSGITFENTINDSSSGVDTLTIANNSGNILFDNAVGTNTKLGVLSIGTGDTTTLQNNATNIITTGDQTYGSAINVDLSSTLQTYNSGSNITIGAGITWQASSNYTLHLGSTANGGTAGTITIDGAINGLLSGATGVLDLTAVSALSNSTGITTNSNGTINVALFDLLQGGWSQNTATLPAFNATNFELNSGNGPNNSVQFMRVTSGSGSGTYVINDVYGLQGIASNTTTLGYHYQLGTTIDASATTNWNGGAGFMPIGTPSFSFNGSFDGAGYTIDKLYINRPSATYVGLFGYVFDNINNAIQNVGVTNATITGSDSIGILSGFISDSSGGTTLLNNDYTTGSVTSINANSGGLIGYFSNGIIQNSFNAANVSANGGNAGGLVGNLFVGTIQNSYNLGNVSGLNMAGGLIGQSCSGCSSHSNVTNSYNAGTVTVSSGQAGGLIGDNNNTIFTNAYWNTETSGTIYQSGDNGSPTTGGLTNTQSMAIGSYTNWSIFAAPNNSGTWGIIPGYSFPYLTSFYSSTPIVVSGFTPNNTAGVSVSLATGNGAVSSINASGLNIGTVNSYSNGLYYFIEPSTLAHSGYTILTYTSNANAVDLYPTTNAINSLNLTANQVTLGDTANSQAFFNSTLVNGYLNNTANLYSVSSNNITLKNNISFATANNNNENYTIDGALSTTGSGTFTFNSPTTLASTNITTANNQTYNGTITLTANSTLTSTSGLIDFTNTVNDSTTAGTESLTVTGNAEFDNTVGSSLALSALSVSGTSIINTAVINTTNTQGGTGNQTYSGAVTLQTNTALTSSGGLIKFANTVNDITTPGSASLTLTGNGEFDNTVGNGVALSTLSVSGTTLINTAIINTTNANSGTGNQTYTGDTTLGTNTTLTSTGGLIKFGNTVNDTITAGTESLSLIGNGEIDGNVGDNLALSSLSISGTTLLSSGATAITTSSSQTYSNAVTINANILFSGSALSYTTINGGSSALNLTLNMTGTSNINNGIGSNIANVSLNTINTDTGTLTLSGTSTYTGSTTIGYGTLSLGTLNALPNTTAVIDNANFNLNTFNTSIGSLASALTTSSINLGSATLTVGNDNTSTTFAGIVSGSPGNLTKVGTGNLVLTNNNTYAGITDIENGILTQGSATAISSILFIASAGTLKLEFNDTASSLSGSGNLILGANITLTVDYTNTVIPTLFSGSLTGSGSLTKTGDGIFILSGNTNYTGNTSIQNGILEIQSNTSLGSTTVNSGAELEINNATLTISALNVNGSGVSSAGALAANGNAILNSNVNLASDTTLNAPTNADTLTINGTLNGAFNLTLAGSGTMNLNGSIGSVTPLSSFTANTVTLAINGGLVSTSGTQTYNTPISTNSSVIFNAANIILNGSSVTSNGSQTYNAPVTLTADTTLTTTNNITLANGVNGSQNLSLIGSAGNNNFTVDGSLAVNAITITGSNAGNNTFTLQTPNAETFAISANNTGSTTGAGSAISFSNIGNIVGGNNNNTIVFANNTGLSGTVNGSNSNATNTLDYSAYTNAMSLSITGAQTGYAQNSSSTTITTFQNFDSIISNGISTLNVNALGKVNAIHVTGSLQGYINDPINFNGFNVFNTGNNASAVLIFNSGVAYTYVGSNIFQLNGVNLTGVTLAVNNIGMIFVIPNIQLPANAIPTISTTTETSASDIASIVDMPTTLADGTTVNTNTTTDSCYENTDTSKKSCENRTPVIPASTPAEAQLQTIMLTINSVNTNMTTISNSQDQSMTNQPVYPSCH